MSHQQHSNPNSPLLDLIWSPRRFINASTSSMSRVLHTQEKQVNSTCRCKYNKNNISSNPQYLIIIIKTTNSIMTRITCTQVYSKNKSSQCVQEWDITYTPSRFKLHPEVSQYVSVEIKSIRIS